MRKIKFRAWHKGLIYNVNTIGIAKDTINKGMCFAHKEFQCEKIKEVIDDDDCVMFDETTEFMQFTGLQDKNGVDIYEGDIIEVDIHVVKLYTPHFSEERALYTVYFSNGEFHIPNKDWIDKIGVVGNEFENPELL